METIIDWMLPAIASTILAGDICKRCFNSEIQDGHHMVYDLDICHNKDICPVTKFRKIVGFCENISYIYPTGTDKITREDCCGENK